MLLFSFHDFFFSCPLQERYLNRDADDEFEGQEHPHILFISGLWKHNSVEIERLLSDEEHILQTIAPNSQEAIVSCLSLHWVNDLPGGPA